MFNKSQTKSIIAKYVLEYIGKYVCLLHVLKLVYPCHLLLSCLCQARKLSDHVFVCYGYRIYLFFVIFLLHLGIVPTVWYILFFILL
jgi:hypothetical protein